MTVPSFSAFFSLKGENSQRNSFYSFFLSSVRIEKGCFFFSNEAKPEELARRGIEGTGSKPKEGAEAGRHTHLEEARFLLKLLELGLDPVAAPDVRRVPSSVAGASAADLHRLRVAERVGAIRRVADLETGSGKREWVGEASKRRGRGRATVTECGWPPDRKGSAFFG